MVKRIVLWKIKDDQNKQTNLNLLSEGLFSLKNVVNDIVSLEVGLNYSTSDFDIVFIVAFNNPFALKQFQNHPEYIRVYELSRTISINMVSCDYMTESTSGATGVSNNQSSNSNSPFNNNMNNGMNNDNMKRDTLASSANNNNSSAFSLPYGGGKNIGNNPVDFNQNQNNNAYNGYGSTPTNKAAVNFTVSEDLNQIKFATNKEQAPFGAPPNTNVPIGIGNNQSWKCTKCGKTNSSFINMCSCGKRKPMDGMNDMPDMTPNKGMIQQPQNAMMINTGLVPKMPAGAMGNTMNSPLSGNNMNNNNNNNVWICPSCGKSNNDFMKICVCGHRKVENGGSNPLPAYTSNTPNLNKPMMPLPKNPNVGSVKSPNNNEFFNSFGPGGNGNNPNQRGSMGMQNTGAMQRPPMGNGTGPIGKAPNNRPNPMGGNGPMGNGPMNNNPNRPGPMGSTGPMGNNLNRPGPMGGNGPMGNNPNRPGPMGGNGPMGNNPNRPNPMGGTGPMGNNPNRPGPMGGTGPMGNNMPQNNRPNGMNGGGNPSTPPDSWKCPRCGKVLGNFVGQCICGQKKPTRTNMHFN